MGRWLPAKENGGGSLNDSGIDESKTKHQVVAAPRILPPVCRHRMSGSLDPSPTGRTDAYVARMRTSRRFRMIPSVPG